MKFPFPLIPGVTGRIAISALAGLVLASGPATAVEVTGSFTGWWGQPDQENHGVIVSVSRLPSGEKTAVLYWANFDDEGNPSWLFAQGGIQGDTIEADLYQFDGVTFMQPDDPTRNPGEKVGRMQVQFSNCTEGDVSFETPNVIVGTGGFRIARLTNQPGTACSGGIGDDTGPGVPLEEFDIDLISTGVHAGAEGDAEFEIRPGKAEFDVEIENLPAGEYELQVGEVTRGTITVTEDDDGDTEGEIEFRSPQSSDELLLDFDPRGQIIDVLDNGVIVLTSVAPESGDTPGQDGAPPFGVSEIDIELENDGVYPAGEAEAEFEQESDEVEFKVEVEDVPVGEYALFVDGIERGTIQVVNDDDGTEGELEFRFPPETGKLLLDFDPRGKAVEILDNGARIFNATFPEAGSGDDDDSGSDDDNGDDDSGSDDDNGSDSGDGTQDISIEIELTNTGEFPAGSGDASFDRQDGETDFDVEIEDVPAGDYALIVGGVERGTITVVAIDDGTEGDIEFGNPPDDDELQLDFDPRGQAIEVTDGSSVIFTAEFPE